MRPPAVPPRPAWAWSLLAVLLIFLAACSGSPDKAKKGDQDKKPAVPVIVATATTKTVPVELTAIGSVEASASVAIKSQVEGELQTVHFREGQPVRQGDLLFTIDPRPYEAKLRQAEASLARSRAELDNARRQLDRYGSVADKGYVSAERFDQVQTAAATLAAAVQADQAAVDSARLELAYCSIRSPLHGFTGDLKADQGNLIKANADTAMVTINRVQPVFVAFSLPEASLPEVRRVMAAHPPPVRAAVPGNEGNPHAGTLSFLDNAVDPTTGTILLKAAFANEDSGLWPGQFVNVALVLGTLPDAVVVPAQAVLTGQKGQYVYVVGEDNTVAYREVTTTISAGQEVVISTGLHAGDRVVIDGQLRLAPGAEVKIADNGRPEGTGEQQ